MRTVSATVYAIGVPAAAGLAGAGPYSDLGVFVYGDYTSTSEVEGRAIVGGNLGGPSSNYGIALSPAAYSGVDTLMVGGNVGAGRPDRQGRCRAGRRPAH